MRMSAERCLAFDDRGIPERVFGTRAEVDPDETELNDVLRIVLQREQDLARVFVTRAAARQHANIHR